MAVFLNVWRYYCAALLCGSLVCRIQRHHSHAEAAGFLFTSPENDIEDHLNGQSRSSHACRSTLADQAVFMSSVFAQESAIMIVRSIGIEATADDGLHGNSINLTGKIRRLQRFN